jgi:hypothetical protein
MRYRRKYITEADRVFFKLDREEIWKKQNKRCHYCSRVLKKEDITLDHVIPLSKVKRLHYVKNCVVSCSNCNSRKNDNLTLVLELWEIELQKGLQKLEKRTRQAEYRIIRYSGCEDHKGSFSKWERYWEKQGRF